jgi:hypothetical protein
MNNRRAFAFFLFLTLTSLASAQVAPLNKSSKAVLMADCIGVFQGHKSAVQSPELGEVLTRNSEVAGDLAIKFGEQEGLTKDYLNQIRKSRYQSIMSGVRQSSNPGQFLAQNTNLVSECRKYINNFSK